MFTPRKRSRVQFSQSSQSSQGTPYRGSGRAGPRRTTPQFTGFINRGSSTPSPFSKMPAGMRSLKAKRYGKKSALYTKKSKYAKRTKRGYKSSVRRSVRSLPEQQSRVLSNVQTAAVGNNPSTQSVLELPILTSAGNVVPISLPAQDFTADIQNAYWSAVQQADPGAPYRNLRMYFASVSLEILFTNQSQVMMEFDIYNVVPRKNVNQGCSVAWSNGLAVTGTGSAANGVRLNNDIGVEPYFSKNFTTCWKVLSKRVVNLRQGESFRHSFQYSPKKSIDMQSIASDASVVMRGLSASVMVVARGQATNTTALPLAVGTAGGKYDYVATKRIIYKTNNYNTTSYDLITNVAAIAVGAESFENIALGAVDITNTLA